jgi:lysophospholipase L1-like esterase
MTLRTAVAVFVLVPVAPGIVWADDKKPDKVRVLLLGDSTVIGSICRSYYPKADHLEDVVRNLLAAETDLLPVEVINRGQDGDTIHQLLASRYEKAVAKEAPLDYIFILYGLNDVGRLTDFKTEFPANYKKLIARLRADHPREAIVLETVIPYLGEEQDNKINEQVRAVAAAEKLPVLDQHTPFAAELKHGPNMLSYRRVSLKAIPKKYLALIPADAIKGDNVVVMDNLLDVHLSGVPGWFSDHHPNLAGYQVIGKQIASYLAPQLRERAKHKEKSSGN